MENNHNPLGETGTPALKGSEESDSDDDDLLNYIAFPKKKDIPAEISQTSISTTLQGTEVIDSPSTTSPVKVTQDAEEEETTEASGVEKDAEERVKAALIPGSLKKTSQLYWHTFSVKRQKVHEPCRECPLDEALGLNIEEDWDASKKILIQYIECCWFTQRKLVSRSSLTPYHGKKYKNEKEREKDQYEGEEAASRPQRWCNEKLTLLEKSRRKKNWPPGEILQEKMFLQRILDCTTEAQDQTRKGERKEEKDVPMLLLQGSSSDNSRQPDEVNTTNSNAAISDEDDSESATKKSKTEPLRRGDVIEYYNPIFVFGDDQGLKTATIIAVDPKANPVLDLSSGDVLPVDTSVKRVKIICRGKLLDNKEKGEFNTIAWYKLRKDVKKTKGHESNIIGKAKQFRKIVVRRQEILKRKIKQSGLGDCTEMMTRFKRQRKS